MFRLLGGSQPLSHQDCACFLPTGFSHHNSPPGRALIFSVKLLHGPKGPSHSMWLIGTFHSWIVICSCLSFFSWMLSPTVSFEEGRIEPRQGAARLSRGLSFAVVRLHSTGSLFSFP